MSGGDRDDLLERARELQSRAGNSSSDSTKPPLLRRLHGARWYIWTSTVLATLRKWLGPVGAFAGWLFTLLGRWLKWVVYTKDGDGGLSFSFRLTFLRLLLSAIAVFGVHVALSAIYFYGTAFDETVYVTGKQEIETGELYQFGGCTSLPCSTESDNGKFYLIEASLYFPTMLYPEENVFANIPHQDAACSVRGYGIYFRSMRWIYKSLQLYQHVVDVQCRPYTESEIERAVSRGEIVRDQ